MPFPKIENHNLLLDIFENKNGIPNICTDLFFKKKNKAFYTFAKKGTVVHLDHTIYSIRFIPGYLRVNYGDSSTDTIHTKKYTQEKGFAIDLKGYNHVEDYIKGQFRSYGKVIKRSVNRLEACFDIKYTMYYGEMDKDRFQNLMDTLHQMITKRFEQRNETSESIHNWSERCKRAYSLILEKRASLFVIYDHKKPIVISLNYNFFPVHFSYISSYDIDYSKFGLGHIDIYKQLEWCLENQYDIFEMGWGTLDYKRRWSNSIYNFEHHLVFSKKSFPAILHTSLVAVKIKLKAYMVSKNVHVHLRKIKDKLRFQKRKEKGPHFITENIQELNTLSHMTKIDYRLETYSFLKNIVYTFLYANTLHETKVNVYKIDNEQTYIIDGGKSTQKVVFNKLI